MIFIKLFEIEITNFLNILLKYMKKIWFRQISFHGKRRNILIFVICASLPLILHQSLSSGSYLKVSYGVDLQPGQ